MLRTSAPRRRRGLILLVLTALTGAILALAPTTAANAMCRGSLARSCGVPLVIDFPPVADVRVDRGPVPLLATVSGAPIRAARYPAPPTTVVYTSNSPAICTVSGATAVLVAPGTCSVTANAPGDDGYYLDADPVTETFEVLPLPEGAARLTLRVPSGLPLSAGTAKVTATSTVAGAIKVRALSAQVCHVTKAGGVRLEQAGNCRLRATQHGTDAVTASFRVWGFPVVPARARATEVLDVLGKGEESYRVLATPTDVCRAADGAVALIDGGVCRVEVRSGGDVVRSDRVQVTVPAKPTATQHSLDLGVTVYFAFNSDRLTAAGKATLRKVAPKLAKADLVVVYGHTYGPGRNSKSSRALAARRAQVTVAYLDRLGIRSKAVSEVAMAMQQPVSSTASKNRRAEVYYR
jgi:outer membrane protein OmpA-like peptidoglycan-associated protein